MMDIDIDNIRQIVELMRENDLAEFEMEKEGFRIAIKKSQPVIITQQPIATVAAQVSPVQTNGVPAAEKVPEKEEEIEEDNYHLITSPMVGTFYASPSPDSDPFVAAGDEVEDEDVVCILEAMKVMNEIKAEVHGKIVETLVENTDPVEYGQPLFKVELLP